MMASFYGMAVEERNIASLMNIPADENAGGASLESQLSTYRQIFGPSYDVQAATNPRGQDCINEIVARRPVKVGIFKHAQICGGWKKVDENILYEIMDPMPVGRGSIKLQNPAVIWVQNHIYVRETK